MGRDANDVLRAEGADALLKLVRGAKHRKRKPERVEPTKWEQGLGLTAKGELARSPGNVALVLLHDPQWAGVLGFNEMQQSLVWLKPPPTVEGLASPAAGSAFAEADFIAIQQRLHLDRGVLFGREAVELGALAAGKEKSFHPVQQYLDGLKWDGKKRLDRLLVDHAGTEDSEYVRAVTAKTLIGAVARARKPGCKLDTVLVLEGEQGIGKSTMLRALAGDPWFDDHLPDLRDKDVLVHLAGLWIVEVAELDAIKGAESSRVKSFVSRQVDRYRPPYARRDVEVRRSCVFIGTTNSSEYLADATGGRRFWPVRVTRIDVERVRAERDQLWAEADHRFLNGETWHLDANLERDAAEEQEARRIADPWEETLGRELASRDEASVDECLGWLGIEPARRGQYDGKRLAKVLHILHFERRRLEARPDGKRPWRYRKRSLEGEE